MRNLLSTNLCKKFQPSFDNLECDYYIPATDANFEPIHGECGYCKQPKAFRCVADVCRIIPLSHSSVSDFCTCHYLYYLKKILGIEIRPPFLSSALKAGVLWDAVKQKHLGAKDILISSVRNADKTKIVKMGIIDKYEIDDYTVAKVKAIYSAYKYLEIEVDLGYELQAKIDMTYDIILPPSQFVPSITVGDNHAKEVVNLWREADKQSEDERKWIFPLKITGFYDRKYSNYFAEDKLSGSPSYYTEVYPLTSQVGTYLLADSKLEKVVMEVVQMPQQKILKETKKRLEAETPEQLYDRVYNEILSRPSNYFIGYAKERNRYGKIFHRGEFDLAEIESSYKQIIIELLSARWSNNFYKNPKACNNQYGQICSYLPICRNQNMSETIFTIRQKP